MASMVKPTPILRGKTAAKFERIAQENLKKKVSKDEAERCLRILSSVKCASYNK